MTISATQTQPKLTPKGKAQLDANLASVLADPRFPAQFWGVTTAEGELYYNCGGERVLGEPDKGEVNEDTILQLWSMTKLVTTLAVLQLVDADKISLDDPTLIETTLPELAAQPILSYPNDTETLTKRTQPLTLRHLLNHTSGLAYPELHPVLGIYQAAHATPSSLTLNNGLEAITLPLLFEPGSAWMYGVGVDWAGILLERLTGDTLGAYFDKHIFTPLGITSLTFEPTPALAQKAMQLTGRDANGALIHNPGLRTFDEGSVKLHSGGGGLLGTARDYLRLLRGVLAAQQPGGIVSPAAARLVLTDSLPKGGSHQADMKGFFGPWEYYDWDSELGFSLGLNTNARDSGKGRKGGSAGWCGIAKTEFWIDPASGIAAVCATQILSMVWPDDYKEVYNGFERAVYDALE